MNEETNERVDEAIFAFSLGNDQEAEEKLKIIVSEAGVDKHHAYRALAEVSLSLGKMEQAEECCRKALELNPEDLTSVVSLARILVKKGDKEGAESASAKARLLGWKEELAEDETNM